MRRLERFEDIYQAIRVAIEGAQATMWTALPGIVNSYDPATMKAVVQPSVSATLTDRFGVESQVQLPPLLDVLVVFPQGGGYALTFPIQPGDEVLLVFSARCIDNWWKQGGVQRQAEPRMHDLSDGFAIPGPWSAPRVLSGVSGSTVQLRNEAGDAFVEIDGSDINVTTPSTVTIQCGEAVVNSDADVTVTAGGNVDVTAGGDATVTATGAALVAAASAVIQAATIQLKNAGASLKALVNETFLTYFLTHTHSGVTAGPNNTGAVNGVVPGGTKTTVTSAE